MKRSILTICLLVLMIITGSAQKSMNVITFNIRLNTASDKENAWPSRRGNVIQLLKKYKADVFSVQEALYDQMMNIKDGMTGFDYVGAGRDDGNINGEFSAIFYNTNRYTLLENGTFWLSKNPEIPSKSWDAALNRICTWARLKVKKMVEIADRKDPVILTGDFNLTPEEKPLVMIRQKMKDSRQVSKSVPQGPVGTFNGWDLDTPPENRIDYIFINKLIEVNKYSVLTDSHEGRCLSDHYPVLTELQFK